jgi:hypothetical protein
MRISALQGLKENCSLRATRRRSMFRNQIDSSDSVWEWTKSQPTPAGLRVHADVSAWFVLNIGRKGQQGQGLVTKHGVWIGTGNIYIHTHHNGREAKRCSRPRGTVHTDEDAWHVANHMATNSSNPTKDTTSNMPTLWGFASSLDIEVAKVYQEIIRTKFPSPRTTASIHITNTPGQENENSTAWQKNWRTIRILKRLSSVWSLLYNFDTDATENTVSNNVSNCYDGIDCRGNQLPRFITPAPHTLSD